MEVFCEISGKDYRFTAGTKADFAVSVINRKLGSSKSKSKALYIEAAKEGEEPISFGDGASLVSYGHGWRLKTVIADSDLPGNFRFQKHVSALCLQIASQTELLLIIVLYLLMQELIKRALFRDSFLLCYQRYVSYLVNNLFC